VGRRGREDGCEVGCRVRGGGAVLYIIICTYVDGKDERRGGSIQVFWHGELIDWYHDDQAAKMIKWRRRRRR
jgi:hypothetical protein